MRGNLGSGLADDILGHFRTMAGAAIKRKSRSLERNGRETARFRINNNETEGEGLITAEAVCINKPLRQK